MFDRQPLAKSFNRRAGGQEEFIFSKPLGSSACGSDCGAAGFDRQLVART